MAAVERRTPSFSRIPATASNCQMISSKSETAEANTTPGDTNAASNNTALAGDSPNLKPLNIFYIWYYELCRRQNTHPLPAITHGSTWHNNQILDFTADRVKLEDWQPIINALRLDMSLHVVCVHSRLVGQKVMENADTEERVKKIKTWFGTICTKYILKNLLKAVSSCLKITQVLTCLEFDGLQVSGEYLTMIVKALLANKSLKYLSFRGCPIQDKGCQEICDALHQMPNIEILNLASCGLGSKSGEYLGKVVKYQQINRYCESWHSSLRYEDPVVTNMVGLKRLTLNNNPGLGDVGTELIIQELVDDLWVRALDMQRCGVTQNLAPRILDLLQYSRSLRVVDFRRNDLHPDTVAKVLEVLKEKQHDDDEEDRDFQWCYTSTSLDTATYGSYISLTNTKIMMKPSKTGRPRSSLKPPTAVLPTKAPPTSSSNNQNQKVTKEKINNTLQKPDNTTLVKAKEQLIQLYGKLKEETQKRELAEKKCEALQKQVDGLLTEHKNQLILKEFTNMKQYISKFINFVRDHGDFKEREPIIQDLQNALEEVHLLSKPFELSDISSNPKESMMFNSPVELSTVEVNHLPIAKDDFTVADQKLQNMFQSLLGPSLPSMDSTMDLDLNSLSEARELASETTFEQEVQPISSRPASVCSTDSDSVETLKRLLEELSQDDEQSWCTEEVDTVSGDLSADRNRQE